MPYYVERMVGDRWCRMLGEYPTADEAWASINRGDTDPGMARTPSRVLHVVDALPPPLQHAVVSTPDIGRKDDAGKPRHDLVPPHALELVASVLAYGARKYGAENWRKVDDRPSRYFAAAMRHLWAWRRGEHFDPESGEPHLAHAACCVLFLLDDEARGAP